MQESDSDGNNPLHYAFRINSAKVIEIMLKNGFGDIEQRNKQGKTPRECSHNESISK